MIFLFIYMPNFIQFSLIYPAKSSLNLHLLVFWRIVLNKSLGCGKQKVLGKQCVNGVLMLIVEFHTNFLKFLIWLWGSLHLLVFWRNVVCLIICCLQKIVVIVVGCEWIWLLGCGAVFWVCGWLVFLLWKYFLVVGVLFVVVYSPLCMQC